MSTNSELTSEETFVLEQTDKLLQNDGDPTTVTIARAGKNENERRMVAWKKYAKVYGPNRQVTPMPLKMEEVFLTLKYCNLEDADGNQLFKFPLDGESFYRSWNQLLPLIEDEIYDKVILMNPIWAPDQDNVFVRSVTPARDNTHMRTVICPFCDHYQQVDDSPENENLEIYDGELEDWEEEALWFVVTCDLCGQQYKMLSNY
jgi:hypothetical protein